MTLRKTLAMVRRLARSATRTRPIVLMGYYNPIYRYGAEPSPRTRRRPGSTALIVVDLPPEEDAELCRAGAAGRARLHPPRHPDQRRSAAAGGGRRRQRAFSITSRSPASPAPARPTPATCAQAVARMRRYTDLPVAVGFGIKTPAQAAEVASAADAAVVGTAHRRPARQQPRRRRQGQARPRRGRPRRHPRPRRGRTQARSGLKATA